MLKVRLMGTREDIQWFQNLIQNMPELNVMSISAIYSNSGTSNYYRCYTEIENKNLTDRNTRVKNTGKCERI